ncbi:CsbD family protein [Lentisalinibacter sediminis]|uniref:CsbD family protein n=1 Tax=Lentisalinibacter sediminis TaxID=2992237 RepID=UPI0038686020
MSQDEMKGQWRELKGQIRQRWGKVTDDDLERISGKTDELIGTLQQRYGESKEWAQDQVEKWQKELGD